MNRKLSALAALSLALFAAPLLYSQQADSSAVLLALLGSQSSGSGLSRGAADTSTASGLGPSALAANPQLALSAGYYPVTAGDVYELAYAAGSTPVTYRILVDSSYKVRVSNLAVIDATGKSFSELKAQVETVVSKNYPLSGVQFGLVSPAVFRVTVRGEVVSTAERQAWPLTRLSEILPGLVTPYSSIRDVEITSASGKTSVYDLFRAYRSGDRGQDPLLRPNDVITLRRYDRSVTLNGAVERPGTYQLLPGETLKDLVSYYGSGLTQVADPTRIEIVRYVGSPHASGQKILLGLEELEKGMELMDYDRVTVGSITDLIPVMFMEGALSPSAGQGGSAGSGAVLAAAGASPEGSNRLTVRFNLGEDYASLVRSHRDAFSAVSDTANAYIDRQGTRIPLNLNPMLYDASYRSEYLVEPNDVLIIPFRQYFVTVAGSVHTPGRYPYIPDRDWSYYIALAGGFDNLKNSYERVRITDVTGKAMKKSDPITPETVIEASTNSFLFYFNQYAPVVTTTLTALSTSLTVYMLLRN